MAINAPIQGTQADIIKRSMVEVDEKLMKEWATDTHLVLQVHDELIYEIRTDVLLKRSEEIKEIMESALPRNLARGVPIIASASTGPHWGALQKL
jgi:DNA polymerase-1